MRDKMTEKLLKDEILKFVEKNYESKSTRLFVDVNIPNKKVSVKRILEENKKDL